MCYPKPGPRCSSHAKIALVKIQSKELALSNRIHSISARGSEEEKRAIPTLIEERNSLHDAEREAKEQWYMTPAGQKELQSDYDRYKDDYDLVKKEHFGRKRQEALSALGIKRVTSDSHQGATARSYSSHADNFTHGDFFGDDEPRTSWDYGDVVKLTDDYLEDSAQWTKVLNQKEQEAVRWYTSNGAVMSHKIKNKTDREPFRKSSHSIDLPVTDEDREHSESLDKAFKKYRSLNSHVVYRGLNDWAFPDEINNLPYSQKGQAAIDYIKGKFATGSTMKINEYMSASADPRTALGFTHHNIVMEIKTNRAAPVGVMSAWGAVEREMLVEGGNEYRVIGVKEDIRYRWESAADRQFTEDPVTVIQLEIIKPRKKKPSSSTV